MGGVNMTKVNVLNTSKEKLEEIELSESVLEPK